MEEFGKVEYKISQELNEVTDMVDKIGAALRSDSVSKSFSPRAEYKRMLSVLSGCYIYLITEFKKWRAIKANNEVAKYCLIKSETTTKFVNATTEKEASNFVRKERYFRDLLEGYTKGCAEMIYTLKKFIEADKDEESHTV